MKQNNVRIQTNNRLEQSKTLFLLNINCSMEYKTLTPYNPLTHLFTCALSDSVCNMEVIKCKHVIQLFIYFFILLFVSGHLLHQIQ